MMNDSTRHAPTRPDQLLSTAEAAELIGFSPATLTCWRCTGKVDIPHLRIGKRSIRYRQGTLIEWLNAQSASEPQA